MKKFIRVVEIIAIVLCVISGASLLTGYIAFKDQTIEVLASIKDFINQPLPIVGVSILGIGIFLYEIIVRTNFGKKALAKIIEERDLALAKLEEKEINLEELEQKVLETLAKEDEKIEKIKEYIAKLCSYSRNINAKELGEKILKELGDTDNGETKDSIAVEE